MWLHEIIERSARAGFELQRDDGSFPPGHDGPYGGLDTPVRNTAHWLITMLAMSEKTGDPRYIHSAKRASEYLLSVEARPMGAAFHCRTDPEKDFANGLIGQAWVIEALAAASDTLDDGELARVARETWLAHPFDERTALWRYLNVDGRYGSFDLTFNHQLWFASSGILIPGRDPLIEQRVLRFLERAEARLMRMNRRGRIVHGLPQPSRAYGIARMAYDLRNPSDVVERRRDQAEKADGYHAFNLYALALLRRSLPSHPFWRSPKMAAVLDYAASPNYVSALGTNRYGYPYNPPGIEIAFVAQEFPEWNTGAMTPGEWLAEQCRRTYDSRTGLLERGTPDAATMAARIYEATRIRNIEVPGDFAGGTS